MYESNDPREGTRARIVKAFFELRDMEQPEFYDEALEYVYDNRPGGAAQMEKDITESLREREESVKCQQRSADSWERSDTDGFLSQWASQANASEHLKKAELAEAGHVARFPQLFDAATGEPLVFFYYEGQYGPCWAVKDAATGRVGQWIGWSKAKTAKARNKHYANKGVTVGTVLAPAYTKLVGNLTLYPVFKRRNEGDDEMLDDMVVVNTDGWESQWDDED